MSKRWLSWIGVFISVCCTLYFVRAIVLHWQSLVLTRWSGGALLAMGLALLLYLATYFFATRSWQLGLQLLGQPVRYARLARILMLSQFAKYLPGNIGHHVGRVVLAKRHGLPTDAIVASMLLDTVLVVLAGAVCSLPALALLVRVVRERGASGAHVALLAVSVGIVGVIAVFAIPALQRKLSSALRPLRAIRPGTAIGQLAQAGTNHCLSFLFGATGLYLLCDAVSDPGAMGGVFPRWLEVTGIYATAWLLGFLMPGAPAGLGVREFVLLLGLSPLFGEQHAATAAGALRLVTTLGDGLAFGLATAFSRPSADEVRT